MLTPSQQFQQAQNELKRLNNEHATRLSQEFNRFEAEMKKRLDGLDALIQEKITTELNTHIPLIHDAVQRIHQKVEKHFGA